MTTLRAWIIIRNGVDLRLVKQRPSLAPNEVAVEVVIKAPTPPRVIGNIELVLPNPPPAEVSASVVEYEEKKDDPT